MPNFEFDAKIASELNRIIHNSHFKRRISLEEQKAQKQDRFLRGKQIAYCDRWRKIGIFINLILRWKNWSNFKVHIQYNLPKDFKVKTTLRSAPFPSLPFTRNKVDFGTSFSLRCLWCVYMWCVWCVVCVVWTLVCECCVCVSSRGTRPWRRRPINFFNTGKSSSEYFPGSISVQTCEEVGIVKRVHTLLGAPRPSNWWKKCRKKCKS